MIPPLRVMQAVSREAMTSFDERSVPGSGDREGLEPN
jgi:hypothetical protein